MKNELKTDMYELVRHERRFMSILCILHLLCSAALFFGFFFTYFYMTMPDRVIVLGRDSTVYLGNSAKVESPCVLKDTAFRAASSILIRRYDFRNDREIDFIFTKRGQGQAKGYLNDTQETFEERRIFQNIESAEIDTARINGQYHALVKGILVRRGIYFGHPYEHKRDFALMMRFERSKTDKELPYKVAGMRYWEEEAE